MGATEKMACPDCGTVNPMMGVVNRIRQYLCKKCGMVYYTPDECVTETPPKGEGKDKDKDGEKPKGQ